MIETRRQWLSVAPWDRVASIHAELCQAQGVPSEQREDKVQQVRQLWKEAYPRLLSLKEALDVVRRCCEEAPFVFNNGNTFGQIARLLIEDCVRELTPLERQIVDNTVSHYVNSQVGHRELRKVLRHFEKKCIVPDAARLPEGARPTSRQPATAPATRNASDPVPAK